MARTHYIAGNWKMNTTKAEAVALAKDLVEQLKGKTNKFMIGVPFVYLDAVAQVVKGSKIRFWIGAEQVEVLEADITTPTSGMGDLKSAMGKGL